MWFEELYAEPSRNGVYKSKEYQGTGTPVVKMNQIFANQKIHAGDFELDRFQLTSDELRTFHLQTDDLIFARTSVVPNGVGKCSLICTLEDDLAFESNLIRVRLNKIKANPAYVFYFFQSPVGRGRILSISNGTAVRTIRGSDLKVVKIDLPERKTQDLIASILSAYDDLIENNRRRIALLEQAARLVYREWFVHLRFPGHEHVRMMDGVPEGWEWVPISSFCTVGRGGSPRPIKNFLDGTVPWYKIGDATASESPFVFCTAEKIVEDGIRKSVLLHPQELILSNSATCGIPCFTGIMGCIHDGWLYFKNLKRLSKWFLYCCLYAKQRAILAGIGEGATQKNLNTDYIGRQEVLLPVSPALLDHFNSVVEPIFGQIFTLTQENLQLRKARDLILPRLMNGEVAV
jgi:type I restriction enzyme S subunit